jgi:hypothetical protein
MANASGGTIVWDLDVNSGKFDSKLSAARRAASDTASDVDSKFSGLSNIVGGTLSKLGDVLKTSLKAGAATAGAELVALGGFGLKTGSDLQKTNISMLALTGSADSANKVFSDLYQLALKSPFAFPDIAQGGKNLLAMGISAKDVVGDMTLLANVSAGTGADLSQLVDIFGNVSANGKAMSLDLERMSENGVAILPALENELHKTAGEVFDMASKGQISSAIFNKALASVVSPDTLALFNNTMPRALDRLRGSLRNLALTFVGVDISNGFKAAGDGLLQVAINLVNQLATVLRSPAIVANIKALGLQMTTAVAQIGPLILPLVNTISTLAPAVITIVSAALSGLTSILAAALPGLTTFFVALNTGLKTLAPAVGQIAVILGTALGQALSQLAGPLKALAQGLAVILPPVAHLAASLLGVLAVALNALTPLFDPLAQVIAVLAESFARILSQTAVSLLFENLAIAIANLLIALTPLIVLLANGLTAAILALEPVILGVVNVVVSLANAITQVGAPIRLMAVAIGGAIAVIKGYQIVMAAAAIASGGFAAVIGVITSPIFLIGVAVAAIVAVLAILEKRFGLVTAAINFFKNVASAAVIAVTPAFNELKSGLDAMFAAASGKNVAGSGLIGFFAGIGRAARNLCRAFRGSLQL